MIPIRSKAKLPKVSVLHVCGDDPYPKKNLKVKFLCSPRMWRWSYVLNDILISADVFSTYVEMILKQLKVTLAGISVLHVCGDDPNISRLSLVIAQCSPRMWRWSFKVFLIITIMVVFSTYVEMILYYNNFLESRACVLHVCGDDPYISCSSHCCFWCSPRMWRWS